METAAVRSIWNLAADAEPTTSPRVRKLDSYFLKESPSPESAERDLDLLEHLANAGLPVPRYIATAAGRRYATTDGPDGKAFWLSHKLPGNHFEQFRGPVGLERVACLATQLAPLHHGLLSAPNPHRFPMFRDSAEDLLKTLLTRETPYDADRLQRLRSKVASVSTLPKQLIHRDYHRGNVLFTVEGVSGFLDFDLVHQGPRLFDICYCASGVLSESFREPGYVEYWLSVLDVIFRNVAASSQERSLAWSMLSTIELIVMRSCAENQDWDTGLMNQGMLFWFDDHRNEIEAAIAG